MNSIDLNVLRNFQAPPPESFWSFASLAYLMSNITTLGIVDAVDASLNLSRVKEIKLKQQDLIKQASDLNQKCGELEERLGDLENDFEKLNQANQWKKNELNRRLTRLSSDRDQLVNSSIKAQVQNFDPDLAEVVLAIVVYVGHLLANILTLGLYGAYQHCVLKNRITELEVQNKYIKTHLKKEIGHWQDNKVTRVKTRINRLQNPLAQNVGDGNPAPVNPKDQIRLNKEIADLKKQITNLQAEQQETERDYKALKATHAAIKIQHASELQQAANANNNQYYINKLAEKEREFEQEKENLEARYKAQAKQQKKQIEDLQEKCDKLDAVGDDGTLAIFRQELAEATNLNNQLNKQLEQLTDAQTKLQKAKNDRDTYLREKNAKEIELNQVRGQLVNANTRAAALQTNVDNLQADVNRLQPAEEYLPFKDRLGPIPPKYIIGKNAEGRGSELDDIKNNVELVVPQVEDKEKTYEYRYNEATTADELFQVEFQQALKKLYAMAEGDQAKIKLNRSMGTICTPAAKVAYRYVALEFIKKGCPERPDACQPDYHLKLNKQKVKIVSSDAEKVLECKTLGNNRQLEVVTHYRRRDDFTPSEKEMTNTLAPFGIDPLSAKCVWAKLKEEDKECVFHLLMEPAMEDTHLDYQNALTYVRNLPPAQVELIRTYYVLIGDMAEALQMKFGSNVSVIDAWKPYIVDADEMNDPDYDLKPFGKQSYEVFNIKDEPLVEWKLDESILDVKIQKKLPEPQIDEEGSVIDFIEVSFLDFIKAAKEKYQVYFKHLKPELLTYQYNKGEEIPNNEGEEIPNNEGKQIPIVTWSDLNRQYYSSHSFIRGYTNCLFSSLMTTIGCDRAQITLEHLKGLRKAMSNYLTQLEEKKNEWEKVKKDEVWLPVNAKQLEEAAELFTRFQNDIKAYYNGSSVNQYRNWLETMHDDDIDDDELTSLEIEIAAHTLGVRIGIFELIHKGNGNPTAGKIDEQGRLVPLETMDNRGVCYVGPHTKETFFMAFSAGYSYYGLYPMLQLSDDLKKAVGEDDFQTLKDLDGYWKFLHQAKIAGAYENYIN